MRILSEFAPITKHKNTRKFYLFLMPMFVILLADSIMSFSFPVIIASKLESTVVLGLILSSSSLVGLLFDFFIPKLFPRDSWNYVLVLGIGISTLFPLSVLYASTLSLPLLFLLASAAWGIYFELITFSQQDYIANEEKKENFTTDWSLIAIFWQLTTLIGPIIGAYALGLDILQFAFVVITFQITAFFLTIFLSKKIQNLKAPVHKSRIDNAITFLKEFRSFASLEKRIFVINLITFLGTLVFSTFWTLGALLGEEIQDGVLPPWLFLFVFNLGVIISALVLDKLHLDFTNLKNSIRFLILGGFILSTFLFAENVYLFYIIAFCSSLFVGLVGPLNDSYYSLLALRNHNAETYLISLNRMSISLAYILGPLLIGFIAESTDYKTTFGIAGIFVAIISIVIYVFHPKKIKLPQKELQVIDQS